MRHGTHLIEAHVSSKNSTHAQNARSLTRSVAVVVSLLPALLLFPGQTNRSHAQTPHLRIEQLKNLGVAYLEENRPAEAERIFRQVIQLARSEALGYANLGIAQLRLGQLDAAVSSLEQARRVAPNNVEVLLLGAEIQYGAQQWQAVIRTAKRVLEHHPRNVMAHYYVFRAADAQRDKPRYRKMAAEQIEQLYSICPDNLIIAVRHARLLAQRGDLKSIARSLGVARLAAADVPKARDVLQEIDARITRADAKGVAEKVFVLENVLRPTSRFRQDLAQLQPPIAGIPLLHFSKPFRSAAQRETPHAVTVRFVQIKTSFPPRVGEDSEPISHASIDFGDVDGDGHAEWLMSVAGDHKGATALWHQQQGAWHNRLSDLELPPTQQSCFVDLDDDGQFEIIATGAERTFLLQCSTDQRWQDTTDAWQLDSAPGTAIGLIDADNEGDLDVCVAGVKRFDLWQNRPNHVLFNVGKHSGLAAIGGRARQIAATDYDDDLDTDLIVIASTGQLQLWENRRHGKFRRIPDQLAGGEKCRSLLTRDLDNDGYEDLVVQTEKCHVFVQYNRAGRFAPAVRLPAIDIAVTAITSIDFDNDGWADIALAGRGSRHTSVAVLRNNADGTWTTLSIPVERADCSIITLDSLDIDHDGDLDLVGIDQYARIQVWRNDGGNANHWLRVQLKGLSIAGSKNNRHGIGSKLEVKAGLFYEMQYVRRPVTHFGLGNHQQADLLRVVWNNGVPQNRFHPTADQMVREVQVLKGSCPYLYCWNGKEFVFLTDTLAGAPLGLQVAAGIVAPDNPRELLTIDRNNIALRDGQYVFQYTSELWETVYLDHVSLWAVDHPNETEVFTDQRFLPPPYSDPTPILTRQRVVPIRAEDTSGRNVTNKLLDFDHEYPEKLRPTRYQGIVEPHCLTLHFGDVSHLRHPVLLLRCWIFWTDTSINVAVSQDSSRADSSTILECWNRDSGWHRVNKPFGLPSGKDKWLVIDVAKQLDARDARIRIRSESQIYWDQAFLAERDVQIPRRITRLVPTSADLHFGGFHELYRPKTDAPHLYRYTNRTKVPVWMDMTGKATRYGNVTELLAQVDDCFAIFTGGDEVTIRFSAANLPSIPPGWQRDFLFYSDGWEKDSDRNTILGQTIEPLPFHGMSSYPYPSTQSYPDDPLHRDYQRRYNTRAVGPHRFRNFVKQYRNTAPWSLPWEREPGVRGDHSQ